MADETSADDRSASEWSLRPWLMAGLLGLAGLLIHLITHEKADVPWRVAVAGFLFFGALAAAFTIERGRWKEPSLFAMTIGLVMAGLAWRAVSYGEHLPDEQYGFASGVVATALALPLFQAGFLKTRLQTPYAEIYHHIWTNAISAAGALAFTGLSWVTLAFVSELFRLLKIDFLHDLMGDGWFAWTYSGTAFGAALGVLRNQAKVLGTLRSVVLLVLSLIAVPLAFGLAIFLLATAVSGPNVLWEVTRNATPILLTCAAGSFVLTSILVRQDDVAMTGNRAMRVAALVLAIVILPLAVFAAVSLGLRLNQYGLAPERLWGLVTVIVACALGVGYWGALIRGGKAGWARRLREANFILAVATCGLALFLALPILNFGTISAGNQLHRLESGKVSPDKFDYAALRWDFGEAGQRALARLAKDSNPRVAELAQAAIDQKQRVYLGEGPGVRAARDFDLRVQPDDPDVRKLVLDYLTGNPYECRESCVALDLGAGANGGREVALIEGNGFRKLELPWREPQGSTGVKAAPPAVEVESGSQLKPGSTVEIRTVQRRYIFVDGKPMGQPLD
jgi:hypothetical protein